MKLSYLYPFTILSFCFFALLGLSTGPTSMIGDRTLSPTSGGGCDGCHANPGNFAPNVSISLTDSAGTLVNNGLYKPGASYTLSVVVNANPVNSIVPLYGSQTVLMTNNYTQAGSLSAPTTGLNGTGSGAKITWHDGRAYLEHNSPNSDGIFNATWIAPAIGTGTVSIYSMGLAINNNGAFTGDNQENNTLILQEDPSVGIDQIAAQQLHFSIYPNPSVQQKIRLDGIEGEATISVKNMLGALLYQKDVFVQQQELLDLSFLPKGLCFIQVQQAEKIGVQTLYLD